ncbi:FMN-dependent dehydrogenase-domain-containing protein [Aspergillus pseudocaelatus]|uniref:FMN-dependent dehydrogenase-domain-containing protein n=1 Tax=Aspergillus pseudocaelatus TaxID=1825620 RepID=A0ABQ6WYQ0_9EURO|nr:FMN-dependent dehydrogenase-domain-containing protein [Aspergillus pseudocaelatus]
MEEIYLEKKHSQPTHDAHPDKAAGNVVALDDNEVEQFYGSSTTHAYRLKSELFASQGIGSVQPPIQQELSGIVHVSYSSIAYYIGLILGASFWGISSDLIGRRPAFNLTVLIAGTFLCAVAGSMNFVAFSALWAVIGTAAGGNVPVGSMMFLEFVPRRSPSISSHSIDCMVEPRSTDCFLDCMGIPGQFQLPNRHDSSNVSPPRYTMITLGGMSLVFTIIRLLAFKLPETPRYLLSQGRDQDAVEAVNHVARQNGRPEPLTIGMLREIDTRLGTTPSEDGAHARISTKEMIADNMRTFRGEHYRALFATSKLSRHTIIIWVVWLTIGIGYPLYFNFLPSYLETKFTEGSSLYLTYRNYCITSAVGIVGPLSAAVGVNTTLGRRYMMGISSIVTAVFLFAYVGVNNSTASLAFSCVTSILANFVANHNTENSCWIALYGKVYDVTHLLSSHPGGAQAILRLSGRDATDDFDPIHPSDTLASLQPALIGSLFLDEESSDATQTKDTPDEIDVNSLLNLEEIEKVATSVISKKAWAYYYSAADDKITKDFNTQVYRSLLLRPRVFVDCRRCDVETELLGWKVGLPIYVSPTAMARLGHPSGEAGIAEACGAFGALQIIANNSSLSPEQVVANAFPTQVFGWQLYVQLDRRASEAMLARVNRLDPIKFVVLTLDAPVSGKREDDERINVQANPAGCVSTQLFAGTDPSLTWHETLEWLSQHTNKPIILKGLQTHEDVAIAARYTPLVQAVILSNHGGRSLDTAPPAVHTLLEVRKYSPHVFKKMEVWVDGGIRRGTDVVKALCLGAKAVGIGRPALWGLAAGGVQGVERTLQSLAPILFSDCPWSYANILSSPYSFAGRDKDVNSKTVEQQIYQTPAILEHEGAVVCKGKL